MLGTFTLQYLKIINKTKNRVESDLESDRWQHQGKEKKPGKTNEGK